MQQLSCFSQSLPDLNFRINFFSLLSKSLLFDCFVIFASLIVGYSPRQWFYFHPWLPITIIWVAFKVVTIIKMLMTGSHPQM